MISKREIDAFKSRAMNPDNPKIGGTAQNPDVFYQARETCNPYYDKVAGEVKKAMAKFAELEGREYHLFDYI